MKRKLMFGFVLSILTVGLSLGMLSCSSESGSSSSSTTTTNDKFIERDHLQAVTKRVLPGSTDNGDGTYTYIFQPSGGSNDGTDTGGLTDGIDAQAHEPSPNSLTYYDSP